MSDENALAEAQEAIEPQVTEESETTVNETPDQAGEETETKSERPSRARDRIRELNAEKRAAIEFAEMQRQRANELEQQLKSVQTPQDKATRPLLKDFQTPEEWADAVTDWAVNTASDGAAKRVQQQLQETETRRATESRDQSFSRRESEVSGNYEDYWEVTRDPGANWITSEVVEIAKDLDTGPDVLYYLASHPDVGTQIASLPPRQMAVAIGRLEGKAKPPQKAPTPPKVTGAPEPPKPVSGGAALDIDLSKASTADYIKARRQQMRGQ